jgi:hypothetical protein
MLRMATDTVAEKLWRHQCGRPFARARASTPEALAAVLNREDRGVVPLIKKLGIKPE